MNETAVQRFYRFQAMVYDATRWTILHGRRDAVARLNLRPEDDVLEIGCGTGLNFDLLQQRFATQPAAAGTLTGLDFSSHMLEKARKRADARRWQNVSLIEADATSMSLGGRFDAILFSYSLSMIPNYRAALQRTHEHLAPGGRIVVLDFGRFTAWGPLAWPMRAWLHINHVRTNRPHCNAIRNEFPNAHIQHRLGDYYFIARAELAKK